MTKWIKQLRKIVANYDDDRARLLRKILAAEKVIRDRTNIHADICLESPNQIIVIGRYKNRDYIQTYAITEGDLHYCIEMLQRMQMNGTIRRIDAMGDISAVVKQNIFTTPGESNGE